MVIIWSWISPKYNAISALGRASGISKDFPVPRGKSFGCCGGEGELVLLLLLLLPPTGLRLGLGLGLGPKLTPNAPPPVDVEVVKLLRFKVEVIGEVIILVGNVWWVCWCWCWC